MYKNSGTIIIIQSQENEKLFDFSIITLINGKITLKIYQADLNKDKNKLKIQN